ncbi:DNA-directed RNA polymerase, partial [Coemansia sp. RSA 2611]
MQSRHFSQASWLRQSLQAEAAEKPGHALDEDSTLFATAGKDLISMRDMREDTELVHYMQTGKTLAEQLSIMQACLLNGHVERAQRILIGLYRLYPETMKEAADVSVHNEIIGGLLAANPRPLTTEALLWYDQMERHYSIKPNTNTFAILISGFVNGGMRNVAVVLMQEMLRCGHTFHDLLLSTYLSDTDIDQIRDVARSIISQGLENSDVATNLLNAVSEAEERLKSLSPGANEGASDADRLGDTPVDGVESKSDAAAEAVAAVAAGEENTLLSTNVEGIEQLKGSLKSLYSNELEGYNLQLRLERDTYDSALARFREISKRRGDPLLMTDVGALKRLSAEWLPQLEALVEEEQERCERAKELGGDRIREHYGR